MAAQLRFERLAAERGFYHNITQAFLPILPLAEFRVISDKDFGSTEIRLIEGRT